MSVTIDPPRFSHCTVIAGLLWPISSSAFSTCSAITIGSSAWRVFDVRREGNVPTLLAVLTLLAAALVAATIATTYRRPATPYARTCGATALGTLLAFSALRALGREPMRWVLAGAALMFAGAVGVEMLQGDLWSREGAASSATLLNFGLATLEESLELLGGAFLLRGLLVGLSARLAGQPLRLGVG